MGSGISGVLLSAVLLPRNISVGASGAIYGLLGAKISRVVCCWGKISYQEKISSAISFFSILFFSFILFFSSINKILIIRLYRLGWTFSKSYIKKRVSNILIN
jgi:hypothetical protein